MSRVDSDAHTLLLRLTGPMQSWGTQSRFIERDTEREPSKSGVIGLLCAALGRPRDASIADLAVLKMGVRIDRPGKPEVDYHTAGGSHRQSERYGVAKFDRSKPDTVVSYRHYLADADFLVGMEGDEPTLRVLDKALRDPVWPLFLGRRAFVPGEPVRLPDDSMDGGPGLRQGHVKDVLCSYDWPTKRYRERGEAIPESLRLVLDVDGSEQTEPDRVVEVRRDVPISFQSDNRVFAVRYVETISLPRPEGVR